MTAESKHARLGFGSVREVNVQTAGRLREDRVLSEAGKVLSGYEASAVRALLHAACSSPTARQAKVACTALLLSCWRDPPTGSKVAVPADLPLLVNAIRVAVPDLRAFEDYLPLDPRLIVRFRARRGERTWDFRVHPGSLESPLDVLQQLTNYADALDPSMQRSIGFGIGDMIDVAGAMLERELSMLSPAWSGVIVSVESPPVVTEAEIDAAARYLWDWSVASLLPETLTSDGLPMQHGRAVQVLTMAASELSFAPGPFSATLGPAVVVHSPAGMIPAPAGLILEGLDPAVMRVLWALTRALQNYRTSQDRAQGPIREDTEPASRVSEDDAADRWRARAWSDLEVACRGVPANIFHGTTDSGHELVLVVTGHRHVLAIDLVAAIAARDVAAEVEAARERLADFGPGSSFALAAPVGDPVLARLPDDEPATEGSSSADALTWPAGFADAVPFPRGLFDGEPAPLAPGTEVTRLVVVDGLWQPDQLWPGGIPACTLAEFRELLLEHSATSTDREELWGFLDEITRLGADGSGRPAVELWYYSILDAWDVWRDRGVLYPAWSPQSAVVRMPPRAVDQAWERAAELDKVDELLTRFDLPGIQSWMSAIQTPVPAIDASRGPYGWVTTLSLESPRTVLFVSPDQQLIVGVLLDFLDGLTFSRAQMITLANTVQDTLCELARTDPDASAAWCEVHEDGPAMVTIRPRRLADDGLAVRLGVIFLGEAVTELWCDPVRLEGADGAEIHRLFGDAIQTALLARSGAPALTEETPAESDGTGHLRSGVPASGSAGPLRRVGLELSQEDRDRVAIFAEAWQRMPPRVFLRRAETAFRPYSINFPQTLTGGGMSRAARAAARLLDSELTEGNHPMSAVIHQLCPATLRALHQAARQFDARDALAAACAEVERAFDDRFTAAVKIEISAAAPWEPDELCSWIDTVAYDDAMTRSRVAGLLVECLLNQQPDGHLTPDRRDVHHLLDHAHAALKASLIAQHAYAALGSASLSVSDLGDLAIIDTEPGEPRVDIAAWHDAQLEAQHEPKPGDHPGPSDASALIDADEQVRAEEPGVFHSLRAALEEQQRSSDLDDAENATDMLAVDDALMAGLGFSLDSILAVLKTVTSWPVPSEPRAPIAQVKRGDLVENVAAWSGLANTQIQRAVDACTLTTEDLQQEGMPYWQVEKRGTRLGLRPLIIPPGQGEDDELWLLPRCAHATQRVWARYLNDCRLPGPDKDLPEAVHAAIDEWRRHAERRLERSATAVAEGSDLPFRPGLTIEKAAMHGLDIPGEIDLLVADPRRRLIWVAEAKHLREPFGPMEIAFHLAKFHGPQALAVNDNANEFRQFRGRKFKSHDVTLREKVEAIRHNIGAAVRALAISDSRHSWPPSLDNGQDGWQVVGVFVTSHVEVAAFAANPSFPFVSIDRFAQFLRQHQSPHAGWWKPTEGATTRRQPTELMDHD